MHLIPMTKCLIMNWFYVGWVFDQFQNHFGLYFIINQNPIFGFKFYFLFFGGFVCILLFVLHPFNVFVCLYFIVNFFNESDFRCHFA
jgi:hypothetical protein